MFKTLRQHPIYQDAWLEFFQDEIEFPDGSHGTYAWAKRKNGVGIVVVTTDKKILLHREYRYVIKDYSLEIQGGGIDEGETPLQAAVRELKEESGIEVQPESVQSLGAFYPLNSFNTELVTLFMVEVDKAEVSEKLREQSEAIDNLTFFTFDEVLAMIDDGRINDASTANVLQMAIRKIG
jgi:ADP-ribose pyrophosphatase